MLDEFIHEPRTAYFSMEIALKSEIPTYAGGLGMLAGDTLRSAADLRQLLHHARSRPVSHRSGNRVRFEWVRS